MAISPIYLNLHWLITVKIKFKGHKNSTELLLDKTEQLTTQQG